MPPVAPDPLAEPVLKRTVVFIDGQNLFNAAKIAFGYTHPNYDPVLLADKTCADKGWTRTQIRFYTGMPSSKEDPSRHKFWKNKLDVLRRQGVFVFTRSIRYRDKVTHWPQNVRICLPDGSELSPGTSLHKSDGTILPAGTQFRVRSADEKGVDTRMAIDLLKLAFEQEFDVALIFSQDQDLSEATEEIPRLAHAQGRWIKVACAFPDGPLAVNHRGIDRTDWVQIDRMAYDACLDPFDYRTGIPSAKS
jgi:uncharacterized LabA/DUF88 family protein